MDLARQSAAKLIGCKDRDLTFTSGGTEAINYCMMGSMHAQPERTVLVTSQIEHSAVRETANRIASGMGEVIWLPNDEDGVIDLDALADVLKQRADEIALVSVMWANNETGVIQPVPEIGRMCADRGVRFHTDATQWVGKLPCDVSSLPIDLLNFAPHKFHGPKGIGGLYIKPRTKLPAQVLGGPQERQRRGGTENVPGILGMGVACELAMQFIQSGQGERIAAMRDGFEQRILREIEGTSINGGGAPRQWSTSNVAFERLEAEAILLLLSERGVCASGGSACASGSIDPSPVLKAMGLPMEKTHGSVRFSLSRETTQDELDRAYDIICTVITKLRKSMSAVAPQPR
jgi:cysteine desulfurase